MLGTLSAQNPHLETFVTLSPVPGFRSWLQARMALHATVNDAPADGRLAGMGGAAVAGGGASSGGPPSDGDPHPHPRPHPRPHPHAHPHPNHFVPPAEAAALSRLTAALAAASLPLHAPFETPGALHEAAPLAPRPTAPGTLAPGTLAPGPMGLHEGPRPAAEGLSAPPAAALAAVREALVALCARYLCLATKRQRALDPVAAFHLRNGAQLLAIHWGANPSTRGLRESAGMMVNYYYDARGDAIERNHSAYVARGEIAVSVEVKSAVEELR